MSTAQLTPKSTVKVTSVTGNYVKMGFRKNADGSYRISITSYDRKGFYQPQFSREETRTWGQIESEIDAGVSLAAEKVLKSVEIYN